MKTFQEFILECELIEGKKPLPIEKIRRKIYDRDRLVRIWKSHIDSTDPEYQEYLHNTAKSEYEKALKNREKSLKLKKIRNKYFKNQNEK